MDTQTLTVEDVRAQLHTDALKEARKHGGTITSRTLTTNNAIYAVLDQFPRSFWGWVGEVLEKVSGRDGDTVWKVREG